MSERPWCVYRNLVHTCYREIRHIGPQGDRDARLEIPDGDLFSAGAANCRRWRAKLKGTDLFRRIETETSTDAVLRPYREVTDLEPEQLIDLFRRPGWAHKYGGAKWATITEHLLELREALDREDWTRTETVCDAVSDVCHNSGKLIPDRDSWERCPPLREKWPRLCS